MLSDSGTFFLAVAFLIAVGLAWLGWLWAIRRRTRYTTPQLPLYVLNYLLGRMLWRTEIRGEFPIPPGKGAVIVCNHTGPIDPGFIGLTTLSPVHWMVAREYCERGLAGFGLRILQAIPTNRGGVDTRSTKLAIKYAQEGELVGMFPEGRINETNRLMLPGRPGAALVALRARVPIVPCYLTGSPNDGTTLGFLFTPARTRLTIGKIIDLTDYYDREPTKELLGELTIRIMKEIALLAGRPDFEPQLAGRGWKTARHEDGEEAEMELAS